jgi:hypothetical protein
MDSFQLDIQTKLMRGTLLTNLRFLEQKMPPVYEFFKNYTQERVKLAIDENGHINMTSNGAIVYDGVDPKEASVEQVDKFEESPRIFSYAVGASEEGVFKHEKELFKINSRRKEEVKEPVMNPLKHEGQCDVLAMIGCGLGYHIEEFFNRFEVKHFFLFEPDPDCFYCLMHVIDLKPIFENCFRNNGEIVIKVGGSGNQFANGIHKLFSDHGPFHISRLFVYRHYLSETNDETFKLINDLAYRYSNGWGFMEDEIIGTAHTMLTFKHKLPFLVSKSKVENNKANLPVVIVGSGPSLDESIDKLKEIQDKCVLFCCGSALKPLLENDIIPDIHIEVERTVSSQDWIENAGTDEQRKKVNLVCLNTVWDGLARFFKDTWMIFKVNDAGTDFAAEYIDFSEFEQLHYCNPSVANGALAVATHLGFEEVYLFGTDFGFKDKTKHHSKDSFYYEGEENQEKFKEFHYDLVADPNFESEDTVYTDYFLDGAKGVMEICLENNKGVKCFNTSDGARIMGTHSLRHENIPEWQTIANKSDLVTEILASNFQYLDKDYEFFESELLDKFDQLETLIHQLFSAVPESIEDRNQVVDVFEAQYKYIYDMSNDKSKRLLYRYLKGSMNYFQSAIMTNLHCYKDINQRRAFFQYANGIWREHMYDLLEELKQNYDKPGKT